ncbi:F-box/LRR-repeat protein 5 [Cynoglossus semilaevis]|uniref:F-box/LRR-repeat protein 5 n=1 Tax=Cynoglossus semilaevis TaxID=244447 RepID=A0A3P8UL46_CYNSE|nr:F-box/LRR-repeat protein 5 [Cynoglossus semilaevis]
MAPFPDEVDVFTGPHWRMKQLVGLYCEKLSQTNFSNNSDFRSFLQSLCVTFKEFKMHEQIENEYIISLLQQRCCTAYNVHSDNKLSEMLSLFEKGLHSVKSEYEQLNYVQQLKERLEAFTQDFLPHMKEEEEVFQPMLMEYFSYEELKDIKKQVMAQHCSQQQWSCAAEMLKGFSLWSQVELQKAFKYTDHVKTDYELEHKTHLSTHISQLPTEILLRFFRYLSPQDLCRCSQVCSSWSQLSKTGSLWRHLYPVHWARGDYYSGPPGDLDQEPDDEWVKSRVNEGRAFQEWDEDADVDESDLSNHTISSAVIGTACREKRLLNGLIQNLLPSVGSSVKTMVLAYSSTVSSKMVRQILSFCPNLTYLDLTQTDVTDSAFDSWSFGPCLSLHHLDLSGCEKITDLTLKKLSVGLGDLTPPTCSDKRSDRRAKLLKSSTVPITLMDERNLRHPVVRKRQAFIFKQGSGRWGSTCTPTHVWVLDSSDLTDIEDAAWSRQGSRSSLSRAENLVETQLMDCCCVCRRNSRRHWSSTSYLQHQVTAAAGSAEIFCGHSTCCSADVAFRTLIRPQCSSGSGGNSVPQFWTKCSSSVGPQCPEPEKKTDQSRARRSLRFLSLSGCYQVTDLGLRALSQRGGLPVLEHLNLSGCLFITEVGLQELVSVCPSLNDEHFYYCDNINGPHADTASGCQNLQCGFRACCRSGE